MEMGQENFMREEFSAWRVQACVSGRRNVWVVREQYKGLGFQETVGRDKEGTYKGNEVASNINLVFPGAFLWGSD